MVHKLSFENRKTDISLYLPDLQQPEKKAVGELKSLSGMEDTISRLAECGGFFEDGEAGIQKIVLTPDFHKGAGIPIGTVMMTKGFVVPQAMGNDINCGMRVSLTDLTEEELLKCLPELVARIRRIFFEGERQIPMTPVQREAMFKQGLTGLLETSKSAGKQGIWRFYDPEQQERDLNHVAFRGSLLTSSVEGLEDFIGQGGRLSYDDQIGSVGGGNHFVEVQRIAELYDGQTANAWGLKKNGILIMIHSGSLMIGHHSGLLNRKLCEAAYPAGITHPENKLYLLPENRRMEENWNRFWDITGNAANFGFANRLFLGLMLQNAIEDVIGQGSCHQKLLYDSPHNFIWKKEVDGKTCYIHRKGACCAGGFQEMAGTPFEYYGEPVMIPGSMGSSSYLLRGLGRADSLWSASHGAGRRLSRGEAVHGNDEEFRKFMKRFHIITPIDPGRSDLRGRNDILKKWEDAIRSEAPYAYKDIDDVVQVHKQHKMAEPVARMEPVFTIKA